MSYFQPENWGNDPNLTHVFQMGWFNHKLYNHTNKIKNVSSWRCFFDVVSFF